MHGRILCSANYSSMKTTTFGIKGMHCASCKVLIEDVCQEIPGVTSCVVDVASNTARIEHDASVDPDTIRREIEGLGEYKVSIM